MAKNLESVKQDILKTAKRNKHQMGGWAEEYSGQVTIQCRKCEYGASIFLSDNAPSIHELLTVECTG
jgi:hypothetical protein